MSKALHLASTTNEKARDKRRHSILYRGGGLTMADVLANVRGRSGMSGLGNRIAALLAGKKKGLVHF